MATAVLKDSALKLAYDFGTLEGKQVIKTKTIGNIRPTATDEQLLGFANALFTVQSKTAEVSRVNTSTITN